jgi:hypothetical protein
MSRIKAMCTELYKPPARNATPVLDMWLYQHVRSHIKITVNDSASRELLEQTLHGARPPSNAR